MKVVYRHFFCIELTVSTESGADQGNDRVFENYFYNGKNIKGVTFDLTLFSSTLLFSKEICTRTGQLELAPFTSHVGILNI